MSGDLHQHAVSYFLENIVRNIDPTRIELVAYATDAHSDGTTERLKYYFSEWRSIVNIDDHQAAKFIHDDGIHVLIDYQDILGITGLPYLLGNQHPYK